MKRVLMVITCLLALARSTQAIDYYIDSAATTDGDGSPGSPFNQITNITWETDSTYLIKANSTLSANLEINTNNVTLTSYGDGARPHLKGTVKHL